MNLNKAFILGNVTRDPEMRALPSGQSVTSFGVATNRFYTDSSGQKKQEAEFHNVVCFGKLADISSRYLNKGSLVLIEGRIKTRSWQNPQGLKQYRTEIIADGLQLAPKSMSAAQQNFPSSAKTEEKQNDIPVIEENYTPPDTGNSEISQPEIKNVNFEDSQSEEIDVKDIPF